MTASGFKKSVLAYSLSALLVLGTVVLPLSHYAWMALGGHFEHPTAPSTESHQGHGAETVSVSVDALAPPAQGASLKSSVPDPIRCDYSTTVVQSSVVMVAAASATDAPATSPEIIVRVEDVLPASAPHTLPWFRGPPLV